MLKRKIRKSSSHKQTSFKRNKRAKYNTTNHGYITYVLIGLALFAFLMGTGFINNVNPPPDGTIYLPATPTTYGGYNSLELHTLNFISVKPTPIPSGPPPPSVPLNCGTSINLNGIQREAENVYSFIPQPGTSAVNGGKIAFWYHDENAMTLGSGAPAMKSAIDSIFPSQGAGVGNTSIKDSAGYFVYPGLYLLDLTINPTGQPIDAIRTATTPHLPDAVYGTWKTYNAGGNPQPNHETLPSGADPFPSSGSMVCGSKDDCYFGSEVVWNVNSLSLTSGHDYLAVFMVHDGDSDPGGSDIGTACATIHYQ